MKYLQKPSLTVVGFEMFDLISIGDARIDNLIKVEDAHIVCTSNKESCEVCFKFGDKIPVTALQQAIAGNNSNNAVAAAKLGLKTAIYVNLGDDPLAAKIINYLKGEGVSIRYIKKNKGLETEQSFVINFQGERTILVYHQGWEYNLPDLDRTKWVYFSSCSYSFSNNNFVGQLENYIERTGANLVYSPGTYQLKHGVKKYPKLLSLTHLFIVNLEEAKRVLEVKEEEKIEVKKLLKGLLDLGPKNVVITDGKEGSYVFDGEKYYKLDSFPAKVVDNTGAGDAFATAVLAGLFYGKDIKEALRWGAANGASVIEEVGPHNGQLTYTKMQEKLKQNAKIQAKII